MGWVVKVVEWSSGWGSQGGSVVGWSMGWGGQGGVGCQDGGVVKAIGWSRG